MSRKESAPREARTANAGPVKITGVSFSACGWLKLYNFGAAKALMEAGMHEHCQMLGSSAGALVACAMVLGLNFDELAAFALDCVDQTHGGVLPAFRLRDHIRGCMDSQLRKYAGGEPHEALAGRVVVSVTTLPWMRCKRYDRFRSYEHLQQVLLATCCMTPLAGLPFRLDGEWVFDGGATDFQPLLSTSTVTVSPFYCSSADIRPSRYVPLWWALYPPRRVDFEWIYSLGYDDARSVLAAAHTRRPCTLPTHATR